MSERVTDERLTYNDGFKAGREYAMRDNKSGCCCKIGDDEETILSACGAHTAWREDAHRETEAKLTAALAEVAERTASMNTAVEAMMQAQRDRRTAESALAATKAKLEAAENALNEAEDTLRLVERPAFPDPDYHEHVKKLGMAIGFGALMTTASAGWREFLLAKGMPSGSEFVAGPCHATVVSTLKKVRAVLTTKEAPDATR